MPSINISFPDSGEDVSPTFIAMGAVDGAETVEVSLQSSLSTVPPVNNQATAESGSWSSPFSVSASDYPGESTLTATIVGTTISASVTFQIVDT
jgi:hypothetical protein